MRLNNYHGNLNCILWNAGKLNFFMMFPYLVIFMRRVSLVAWMKHGKSIYLCSLLHQI